MMSKNWPIAPLTLLAVLAAATSATRAQVPTRSASPPRYPSGADYRTTATAARQAPAQGRSPTSDPRLLQNDRRLQHDVRSSPRYVQPRQYDQRPQYNPMSQYHPAPTYTRGGGWSGRVAAGPAPWTLASRSFYYVEQQAPRKLRLHDIVTIIVEEKFSVTSEGEVDRRKTGLYDAVITDWLRLAPGPSLKPDPQTAGDPKAAGTIKQTYRSEASVENTESMRFRIAATIVDIRPNGNLVLEAHRTVRYNREVWLATLTGIVRPDDITPLNTVLTEDIAELNIEKRQRGHVRDGTRRGWATRLIDALNPF